MDRQANWSDVFKRQKELSLTADKWSYQFRKQKLRLLLKNIKKHKELIYAGSEKDFKRNRYEAMALEIIPTIEEVRFSIANLKDWIRDVPVEGPITLLGTSSWIRYEPKGVVLILGAWNYPTYLTLGPVIGALGAGNRMIIKPSELTPESNKALRRIIEDTFTPEEAIVVEGGASVSNELTSLHFDHIFFTGSTAVAKLVMKNAAPNLTPLTLELGGKSTAIVDETANIKKAARRIVWGKFINAGQTCVAPDYVFVHRSVKDKFIDELKTSITEEYGTKPTDSSSYCGIITPRHLERLKNLKSEALRKGANEITGGEPENGKFPPTILTQVPWDSSIMKEEIFGPILPIFFYDSESEVLEKLKPMEKALALYVFSTKNKKIEFWIDRVSSGGVGVNTCVVHLGIPIYLLVG